MKKVVQYEMKDINIEKIKMPIGATVLGVQSVYGQTSLFALIDVEEDKTETRIFQRVRTGFPVADEIGDYKYLGTYLVESFGITWSIFEKPFEQAIEPENIVLQQVPVMSPIEVPENAEPVKDATPLIEVSIISSKAAGRKPAPKGEPEPPTDLQED